MTDPGPDPVTERWIFGGSAIHSGRRAHLWLDPTGRELIYAAQGHRATETTLDVQRRDRAARRDDPVERAIAHLCDLAARVPQSQRTAFAAYVAVRLARSWSAK
jgi:hypothetical protein